MFRLLLVAFLASACSGVPRTAGGRPGVMGSARLAALPRTVLWAWERPTDLSFLEDADVGVAYLAGTLVLGGDTVQLRPRQQPLTVSPRTRLVAVVRVETDAANPPLLTASAREQVAARIVGLASRSQVVGLQVDFDAAVSDRAFYAALLHDVRASMPGDWPLSITALASWCLGDPWIRRLPIDEAVPMLFQMGPDGREVLARLDAGQDFTLPVCRESVGVSTDEPTPKLSPGRRRYVFSASTWTRAAAGAFGLRDAGGRRDSDIESQDGRPGKAPR